MDTGDILKIAGFVAFIIFSSFFDSKKKKRKAEELLQRKREAEREAYEEDEAYMSEIRQTQGDQDPSHTRTVASTDDWLNQSTATTTNTEYEYEEDDDDIYETSKPKHETSPVEIEISSLTKVPDNYFERIRENRNAGYQPIEVVTDEVYRLDKSGNKLGDRSRKMKISLRQAMIHHIILKRKYS